MDMNDMNFHMKHMNLAATPTLLLSMLDIKDVKKNPNSFYSRFVVPTEYSREMAEVLLRNH